MPSSKLSGDVRRSDVEWAAQVAAGDPAAFEALYRQHAGRLFNLASRMSGTANAEDTLQEIFLLAYRKIGSFRGESSLGTWLYRLGMNHCLDVLRSRQSRMAQVTDSFDEPEAAPAVAPGPPLGTVSRLDLERAIEALPPACRAAFLLHDVEGFGHGEVAAILGISDGTSKSQVHKARLRIRQYLGGR
jgi:RNA polymerase sigma-70 factor, ECF subfamily